MRMEGCCVYRIPGEDKVNCFRGETKKGMQPGFVIAPFDLSDGIYTITNLTDCEFSEIVDFGHADDESQLIFPFPQESTSEPQHSKIVERIKEVLDCDLSKKIIASKVIVKEAEIDLQESFELLCDKFPQAFVFLFHTPQTGTWLGASPELLLKSKDAILSTYALAGTRQTGESKEWDEKNIREQEIVKNYIVNIFKSYNLKPIVSERVTRKAGNIEHLLTEINCHFDASNNIMEQLLRELSPTPALSGFPKELAMHTIRDLEEQPRGFYGGFIGLYNSPKDFNFYVNLRSIRVCGNRYSMQVGGGITPLSDPKEEWIETERKAASILSSIKMNN